VRQSSEWAVLIGRTGRLIGQALPQRDHVLAQREVRVQLVLDVAAQVEFESKV
jgi:hypothetical protein